MTYRAITIGDRPVLVAKPGPIPELSFLSIDKLLIDGDYQRPLNPSNWKAIERIAAAFNWAHFTPIIAAPTDQGLFSVIDGQHRTHAALMIGAATVPAMIVTLSESQQARAFSAINGQITAISGFHIYRAALVAMEPWALACREVVAQGGCELMVYQPHGASKKPRQIYTISLIRRHVDAGRGAMVSAALRAMLHCPCTDTVAIWGNAWLSPWFAVLQTRPRSLQRDLAGFLQRYDPVWIERYVRDLHREPEFAGMSRQGMMQRIIAKLLDNWLKDGGQS
ncbi:ParB-like nuclease domain-containing protein [Loktanella atrilutea]|uniref:ParB-like nuclease domain-containing protein n=1 Tax=Loktanella atrilutea TaxID=366533 RepID=A0A1M5DJ26_LOKAT|nr:ParB N-terminal domain-containing protein [Loktanella atrilutea]SHF67028.1 ParB-like nuclease domain-containing protein [Loktanella atrilutea]